MAGFDTDNEMVVAYRGVPGDERLWATMRRDLFNPAVWSAPIVIGGGAFNSSHAPALCRHAGEPMLAWKGVDGDPRIFLATLHDVTADHSPVPPVTGPAGTAIQTVDRPAILDDGTGRLLLAWRDEHDALLWSVRDQQGAWAKPQPTTAATSVGPALFAAAQSIFLMWAEPDNGRLWWARYTGAGWDSIAPVPVRTGAALTDDTPAVLVVDDRVALLAWKGIADQNVWTMTPGGTPAVVTPTAGAVLTDHGPALGFCTENGQQSAAIRLIWKGADDQHLWWSSRAAGGAWTPPQWVHPAVNTATGPAAVTTRVVAFDDGSADVPVSR